VKFKKMIFGSLTLASSLILASCGAGGGSSSAGEEVSINVEEELAAEPSGEQIVLISNNGGQGRQEYVEEVLADEGFNIEFVNVGGADVSARVIAEVENPTTNVVWGPTQFNFDDMIEAGALYEWSPTWVDQIGDFNRENGYSYSYEVQPKMWMANPDEFSEDHLPATVNELYENSDYHGKYTIPSDFGGTTNRAIVASILGQYLDEDGELGVSDEGWEAMQQFIDNGVQTPEGEDKYINMMEGTTPITFDSASIIISTMQDMETESNLMYFENGQPSNVNELGVVKNDNPEVLAESLRLADFLGSAEFMGPFASEFGNIVTNEGATDQMTDASTEIYNNYTEQDLDWDTINNNLDDWIAKIELEMM